MQNQKKQLALVPRSRHQTRPATGSSYPTVFRLMVFGPLQSDDTNLDHAEELMQSLKRETAMEINLSNTKWSHPRRQAGWLKHVGQSYEGGRVVTSKSGRANLKPHKSQVGLDFVVSKCVMLKILDHILEFYRAWPNPIN